MPLPDYSPRSDSFGNWYFGGFQINSQVEAGYGVHPSPAARSEFAIYLNAALGANNWYHNDSNSHKFRFSNAYEQLSGAVTASSTNYRFQIVTSTTYLNTSSSNTESIIPTNSGVYGSTMFAAERRLFAVANQFSMWIISASYGAAPGTLTTDVVSVYIGWAKNPVFPSNTEDRYRNLLVGTGIGEFISTGAANSSGSKHVCIVNSVIGCDTPTPGANVTDLSFVDENQSYLNIGSAYNALFYPGSGLTIGQIYRIPPNQDPDGNTEQNIWLCAGLCAGWNGTTKVSNAGYKLIRVWSNNIV